jgi:nicotinamidase/pyrazinamidase
MIAREMARGRKMAGRGREAAARIKPRADDALIVVDVQNGFMPGGALAVPRGDEVVPVINRLARRFRWVVLTQDWHTPKHASFASAHRGKQPFEAVKLAYGMQVLWPDHCVQGSESAALHRDLDIPHAQLVIRKGYDPKVDSYSAFIEADRRTRTGLDAWLKAKAVRRVFVCGLATDFCVGWTALDARRLGFRACVVEDASRAIDLDGSLAKAWASMSKAGVRRVDMRDIGP